MKPITSERARLPEPSRGTVPVNGLNLYHEIHRQGEPLVLLHGAMGTIDVCFADLIRDFLGDEL